MRYVRVLSALLVAGSLAVAAWSCGDVNAPTSAAVPAAAPAAPSADLIGSVLRTTGLLRCTPLPYASASKVIGPAGGELRVGPHVLRVPAGALAQPVLISVEAPSETVNSVRFSPEGLQFARSAALTMSYANCNLLGRLVPKRIAYTTDGLDILSYLLSLDNFFQQQVTGRLDHFSRYALAW
jgi:hypothetical protein